ncbi:MAG: hypothetical protein ABS92_01110 [Thiobacillus sp. SCN 63-374]|nr:MAG: hypothetical protein ABS92_01110 [Thiobacillus sp. SCN 63-374]
MNQYPLITGHRGSHAASYARPVGWPVMLGIFLVIAVLAVFFGLVAVTANIIIVALAAGLLLGTMLLAMPIWSIWIVFFAGLMVVGVLPLWVDFLAAKSVWAVSLLGFLLFLGAIYRVLTTPGLASRTPLFLWVAFGFLAFCVVNSLAQWHSAGEFLGGFKRYFQAWGLMFALAWTVRDGTHMDRWKKFLLIVALTQFPFALYELLVFVPKREALAMSIPGLVPIDVVAGTFGANLYTGGANAEMATFLIIVLAYLLAQTREKTLPRKYLALLSLPVLAPLFMGETKVVVILLPLMFVVLYRRELIARPHYGVVGLLIGALLTAAAGAFYLSLSKKTLDQEIADTLAYNVYEKGYGNYALNRTSVLTFWAEEQGLRNPISFAMGNGLGSAQTSASFVPGHIAERYPGYGIGLTAASTLLWETGIFGSGLFLATLWLAWRCAARLRRIAGDPAVRGDAATIQVALAIFGFYLFYRPSLLDTLTFQLVFAALLGYLAWLHIRIEERSMGVEADTGDVMASGRRA